MNVSDRPATSVKTVLSYTELSDSSTPINLQGIIPFIEHSSLRSTKADKGLSPIQQLTHKGGTYRIQHESVIVNDLVAVKYNSFRNQFQATAVKSNMLFIHYK